MARVCEYTGSGPRVGNKVSHSNIKTKTRWLVNLRKKAYVIPELSRTVTLTLASRAIRTIDKRGGLTRALLAAEPSQLSERLKRLRRQLEKLRRA